MRGGKKKASSAARGGSGNGFEIEMQARFVLLMVTKGVSPCPPQWPIEKIILQSDIYNTDDAIVHTRYSDSGPSSRLLVQMKQTIAVRPSDTEFSETITNAWNDYKDRGNFNPDWDSIALVTSNISKDHARQTTRMLDLARGSAELPEFLLKLNTAGLEDRDVRTRYEVIQRNIRKIESAASDDEIFRFCKIFYLLDAGVSLEYGFLRGFTLASLAPFGDPNETWLEILDFVRIFNAKGGTINSETLSHNLKIKFINNQINSIPTHQQTSGLQPQKSILLELALPSLFLGWSENSKEDLGAIERISGKTYGDWIIALRNELLSGSNELISFENGFWRLNTTKEHWGKSAIYLFDEHIERFRSVAVSVLRENDPKFDLPPDKRFAAIIYHKKLRYSSQFRYGIAESLAIVGNHAEALQSCSRDNRKFLAANCVREILRNGSWQLWASINDLLPFLAEAAPSAFLDSIDQALLQIPCPFDQLFESQGDGLWSTHNMTGLLWALETLAWEQELLPRVVLILGQLAAIDPGGNMVNRPSHSLTTIFLPWLPQTCASKEVKVTALRALVAEQPKVGWQLLKSLLPRAGQVSTRSRRPTWRETIPDNWPEQPTKQARIEDTLAICEMLLEASRMSTPRLIELIADLDHLPKPTFDSAIAYFDSAEFDEKSVSEKNEVWKALAAFTQRHRRFHDAHWSLKGKSLAAVESIENKLQPKDPLQLYYHLFSLSDFDLYDKDENYSLSRKRLEDRRLSAIEEIWKQKGISSLLDFANSVANPWAVGIALGQLSNFSDESKILPVLLKSKELQFTKFVAGYISAAFHTLKWSWVDRMNLSDWTTEQIVEYFTFLPFQAEAWDRVTKVLGEKETLYWALANANPYQAENSLELATDNLLKYGRPSEAIDCVYTSLQKNKKIDVKRAIKALSALLSNPDAQKRIQPYEIAEIFKALQAATNVDQNELLKLEWAYLRILDRYSGAQPVTIEREMAKNPSFFCEVVRMIYESTDISRREEKITEDRKIAAANAWHLLHDWHTFPGFVNGVFDSEVFKAWLDAVIEETTRTGHVDVALMHVAQISARLEKDNQLPDFVFSVLNENSNQAQKMRDSFRTEIFNLRGVHFRDDGADELGLAAQFEARAKEVEGKGFIRVGRTFRELSESYRYDAEREKRARELES